jgi:hypothetical protein
MGLGQVGCISDSIGAVLSEHLEHMLNIYIYIHIYVYIYVCLVTRSSRMYPGRCRDLCHPGLCGTVESRKRTQFWWPTVRVRAARGFVIGFNKETKKFMF